MIQYEFGNRNNNITDMDIEQLITSIDRLKNKDDELEQKIDSKKRALDTIDVEISKEKQRLEEKVKELAKSVETKLKESEKIDTDLSNKSSVLARMQKARALQIEAAAQHGSHSSLSEAVNGAANGSNNGSNNGTASSIIQENLQQDASENRSISVKTEKLNGKSLEDFLQIEFEKEFRVKYPQITDRYLDERSFNQVLSILKERMFHSKEPDKIINEYLETYRQSVNDEQIKQLKDLKNQFNRL